MTVEKALIITNESSFKKLNQGGGVTINLRTLERLLDSLSLYVCFDADLTVETFFEKAVPGFQRENNKWSENMQVKFIENILKGFRTEIILFKMSEHEDAQIMDGLQRMTAIIDFMQNKFSIFGDLFFSDIQKHMPYFGAKIIVDVLTFQEWQEVANFYIDMNENITHSPEDIEKAKIWFEKNHNILVL